MHKVDMRSCVLVSLSLWTAGCEDDDGASSADASMQDSDATPEDAIAGGQDSGNTDAGMIDVGGPNPPQTLAIAYVERNGTAGSGYDLGQDDLIARIVDQNGDGTVSAGDTIFTAGMPDGVYEPETAPLPNYRAFTTPLNGATLRAVSWPGQHQWIVETDTARFVFRHESRVQETYQEVSLSDEALKLTITDVFVANRPDLVECAGAGSPSGSPLTGISRQNDVNSNENRRFIDVVIYTPGP